MHDFLRLPAIHGALTGIGGAIVVDLVMFLKWKPEEKWSFDWRVAIKRYLQGAIGGILAAMGLSVT